jgi:hypothetical protein
MLRALFENEIKTVTAHFDGSGDSGEIHTIEATSIDAEIVVDEDTLRDIALRIKPTNENLSKEWVHGKLTPRDFDKRPLTLHELVMQVCYDELEDQHGGWEINAGSFGKIHIDVPLDGRREHAADDPLWIECNEYEEDYSEYDEEEYNDE